MTTDEETLREKLKVDLTKALDDSALRNLKRDHAEGFPPWINWRRLTKNSMVEAVIDRCLYRCMSVESVSSIKTDLTKKEREAFKRKARTKKRRLDEALTIIRRARAMYDYYGGKSDDPNYPIISTIEVENAENLFRRALIWEKQELLEADIPLSKMALDPLRPLAHGRPTDSGRELEKKLTELLLCAGLKKKHVANYAFEFMELAGVAPKSKKSIETRIANRKLIKPTS